MKIDVEFVCSRSQKGNFQRDFHFSRKRKVSPYCIFSFLLQCNMRRSCRQFSCSSDDRVQFMIRHRVQVHVLQLFFWIIIIIFEIIFTLKGVIIFIYFNYASQVQIIQGLYISDNFEFHQLSTSRHSGMNNYKLHITL